ncbi:MAG: hypothetical protein A2179_02255 [Elusimicrobia bacterium GWC2_63_65]|nr:MAG: hypothetical protein A2179_02255 [Elusimicrobia bacterium GWC2_63_65]
MKNRYVLIAALSVLVYLPSVFGGFMWDDEDIITGDSVVHSLANAGKVFSTGYWKRDFPGAESRYRPMRSLLLMAEWKVFGRGPAGYHAVNVLLNAAAACLALWLAWLLFRDPDKAFAAALVFALHPVHVESVAWLKNVTDILMFIFAALSAGLAIKSFENEGRRPVLGAASAVFFLLALFSKESAVMLPALLAAWLWLARGERPREALGKTLPLWVMSAVFLLFAVYALRRTPGMAAFHFKEALLGFAQYSRLVFLPLGLNADRGVVTLLDAAGPLLLAGLVFYGVRAGNRVLLYSAAWIVLCLVPFLDTRFTTGRPIAEQRLYMAVLGLGLACGAAYRPVKAWRYSLLALCLLFGGAAAARNFDWIDPVRLWEKTVAASPASPRARNNLGVSYERAGRFNDAAREYEFSMAMAPGELSPRLNIADLLYRLGNRQKAEQVYSEALSRFPSAARARLGLLRLKLEAGKSQEALILGQELLKERPDHPEALNAVGVVYMALRRDEEARSAFSRAAALSPEYADAFYNLASLHRNRGEFGPAAEAYEALLRIAPAHADALNNLAILSDMAGNEARAVEFFKRAQAAAPGFYQASYNLGGIYYRKKMYLEALSEYSRVLASAPGHEGAERKAAEIRKLLNEDRRK